MGLILFVCSLAYSADVMRRNISVISGQTSADYSTYTDTSTGFVVSECIGDYNPKEKLGISYDSSNHLMNNNLPVCAADKKSSGACWVEYDGFDGNDYRVKICHVGSGYTDNSKCVSLTPETASGEFSSGKIRTFGLGDEEYSGGYLNGDIDCPDLTNNINGNGYGFVYEATNPKYKDFTDYYNNYCEPLIIQNTPAYCVKEGQCPCDKECREHGFMPDPRSDYWKKEIGDETKICYYCNKQIRAISYFCEKIYKCINKYKTSEAYQLLANREHRQTLKKLYGKGHYLCGYYNNTLCGCAKLQLVGGPRHFSRIARVDNVSTHNCFATTTSDSPQCNMFEEQLKVRQFYDSQYIDTSEMCPESHNAELGKDYRGSFFFPKIVVVAGKNERIIGYSNNDRLMSNPVFYYNKPIIGSHSTPDAESEYGVESTNSLYVSNFYPEIFTIGGTYSIKETYNTCINQPTGEYFFVVIRLEYNIATGLSQLVAYSVKPVTVMPSEKLRKKIDGSILKFYMEREVVPYSSATGAKAKVIDDFKYNYDPNTDIARQTLLEKYPVNKYKYLEFTRIGGVNRPPLMYGYVNENHLSSPLTLRHDYNAMMNGGGDKSAKVKIALNPSNLSAVEETDTSIEQELPMVDQSLRIRSANATAYQDSSGDVKYQGTGVSNRALLYMQSFTVDYVNPCAILQNFTDLPYSRYLKDPVDNIAKCGSKTNYKEKLACYTTFQLIKECNAYENCLLDDRSMSECQSKKSLPIQITSSSGDDLRDYQVNKDWRSKPKICIISGFDFAEHIGDLPNTKKFGYFGNPIYDYTIALKRPKNSLFPSVDTLPLTTLGKAKSATIIGGEQFNNKYIISTPADYFNVMKNERYNTILNNLRNRYVFSLTTFKDTDVSLLKNYFDNCGEITTDAEGNTSGVERCEDSFEVRTRKVDEVLGEICTEGDTDFGGGGWSDLNPRDMAVDYDVYIPYRCQYVEFEGTGAGGAGFTTDDTQAPCITPFALNAIYETCKKIIFVKLCVCPISWDIKVMPLYDATGGGGGHIKGILDLNKIDIFDGYLQVKVGETTTYTQHKIRGLKSGGKWCYVGTSATVNNLNGGYRKDSDWTVVGGSHKYWYRDLTSSSNGNGQDYDKDDKKGNTTIGYRNYSFIGANSTELTDAQEDINTITELEDVLSSNNNVCIVEKNAIESYGYTLDDIQYLSDYQAECDMVAEQNNAVNHSTSSTNVSFNIDCETMNEEIKARQKRITATKDLAKAQENYDNDNSTENLTKLNEAQQKVDDLNSQTLPIEQKIQDAIDAGAREDAVSNMRLIQQSIQDEQMADEDAFETKHVKDCDSYGFVTCEEKEEEIKARQERIIANKELQEAQRAYDADKSDEKLTILNNAQQKVDDLNSKTLPLQKKLNDANTNGLSGDFIEEIESAKNEIQAIQDSIGDDNFLEYSLEDCYNDNVEAGPGATDTEICDVVDAINNYNNCWQSTTQECYKDTNRTTFNTTKSGLTKCKLEEAKVTLENIKTRYAAESISAIKRKLKAIISKYLQPTDTVIAAAERGGSPIDYRIEGSGDGPYVEGGGKYTQKQISANTWYNYFAWSTLVANPLGTSVFCLIKGSGPAIFGATDGKASKHKLIEFIDESDLYKNRDNTKGKYSYNNDFFINNSIIFNEGHGSKLSKEETSEGSFGSSDGEYNKKHSGLRNDWGNMDGKNDLADNYHYHQFNAISETTDEGLTLTNVLNNGTGGPFIHRMAAGGGAEGNTSLSLSNVKIKYEQDVLTGAEYPKMDEGGAKEVEIDGANTDASCSVRCPPLYRYMRDKNFVFPNGDVAKLDVICEYIGDPEHDMEVPNGKDVTPKKCYIVSHYTHTDYGDVYGKIIRNDKYCPIVKCANGTFGFSGHTTDEEKKRWQYDRKAMMCKYPDGSHVSFNGGATTQAGKSAYYLSMMFDKNIYTGMSYESMQLNDYYTYFRGNSYKLASCARNDAKDYVNDEFDIMDGWILKCGNGFWQLPDTIDPPISLYEKPSSTSAGYPYEDAQRDRHYTENNKPMWYTDWVIFNHVYEIDGEMTSGIKKFDKDYLGVGITDIKTKRLALKAYCPPIDATTYDFDVEYSGNANWDAVEENSDEVEATSCAAGDRMSFKSGTILPRRRCMRNGMWGPILNPCSRGCQEETDANGMFWSMANMDTALGIDGTGNATITGVCEGGLYINSADYTSVSQAQLPTRKCKVSTATWEPVPPGFKCGDDLVCIPDDNIGQVYIPYIRYIDNSSVSLKSFKDIAISIKNGSYTLTDATKVNDNSYFIFDTTKYTSNLSFQYYQAINTYVNVDGGTISFDYVDKVTDRNGYKLIDTSGDMASNYYVITANNIFTTAEMQYIIARDEERNEFLNVYRWLMDLQYPERNYTGEWSYKCNLSQKNSSLSSNASKMTAIQERYKNTTLSIYIPLISDNNTNIKRIAIFSPSLALEYATNKGYTLPNARSIIKDNTNIKFRIPLQLSGGLRYKNGNSTSATNYPNAELDDYPMILYDGFNNYRVYGFEKSLTEENKMWQTYNPTLSSSIKDCNGIYTGYIKHNTLKYVMYSETPTSEKVHFISAYCYNGRIFGYHGIDASFKQDTDRTVIPNEDNINNTPLCFLSELNTTSLPAQINTYMLSKYPDLQNTALYPLQKNSYIMAMLTQYWKTYIQPQKDDKEYFIENSTKATANSDPKITEIHSAYQTGKRSKYFRIVPRRVEWIVNGSIHDNNFVDPTNQDYGKINTEDPYCEKTACMNQKNNSNIFNQTIADVYGVWSTCSTI